MDILKIHTAKRALGDFGEDEAIKLLRRTGYKILERNYVANDHEVDIIAEDRDTIAFIEVKTRDIDKRDPREARPCAAVTPKKQRSIIAAVKAYIAYHIPKKHVRLDIIEVYTKTENGKTKLFEIKHLKGAFDQNSAYGRR